MKQTAIVLILLIVVSIFACKSAKMSATNSDDLETCNCCVWKRQVGTGQLFECTKPPMQTIEVKVCILNIAEAKELAEDAIVHLTQAPQNLKLEVACQ